MLNLFWLLPASAAGFAVYLAIAPVAARLAETLASLPV